MDVKLLNRTGAPIQARVDSVDGDLVVWLFTSEGERTFPLKDNENVRLFCLERYSATNPGFDMEVYSEDKVSQSIDGWEGTNGE